MRRKASPSTATPETDAPSLLAVVGLVVQPLPVRQAEERLFLIVFKDEPKSSQDAGAGAAQVRHVLEDASRLQRLQTANELSTVLA